MHKEFIDKISSANEISKKDAKNHVQAFFETITELLDKGEKVQQGVYTCTLETRGDFCNREFKIGVIP